MHSLSVLSCLRTGRNRASANAIVMCALLLPNFAVSNELQAPVVSPASLPSVQIGSSLCITAPGDVDSGSDVVMACPAVPRGVALTAAVLRDKTLGAMYGLMIGDALSMPVHWYYNPRDIVRDYGRIVDFQAPKPTHPSSILNLSSTGGAGRGSQEGNIIGDVINHGKKKYWQVPGTHYHATLAAGENTLNAQCARLLTRTIVAAGNYTPEAFLSAYVTFMTTPGSHNDVYAETYHRMFFKNMVVDGKPPAACADDDGHNVASMGGFVMLPPVALIGAVSADVSDSTGRWDHLEQRVVAATSAVLQQMYTTHNSAVLAKHASVYASLLTRVLYGEDFKASVASAGSAVGVDIPALLARGLPDGEVVGRVFSTACYIEHSFPSLLYLAYKYSEDPEAALIANTNVGGENCHRGSALGALLGVYHGADKWPLRWREGLFNAKEIGTEADRFASLLVDTQTPRT